MVFGCFLSTNLQFSEVQTFNATNRKLIFCFLTSAARSLQLYELFASSLFKDFLLHFIFSADVLMFSSDLTGKVRHDAGLCHTGLNGFCSFTSFTSEAQTVGVNNER